MAKEIKNRRENILINSIPPEILTAEQAADAALDAVADAGYLTDETAATAGYVKNTDYATNSIGGVFKTSSSYATATSAGGNLYGVNKTLAQYNAAEDRMFICRGTLENIIASLVKRELIALLGGLDTDGTGTTLTSWLATKTEDGWSVASAKSTPTPP